MSEQAIVLTWYYIATLSFVLQSYMVIQLVLLWLLITHLILKC